MFRLSGSRLWFWKLFGKPAMICTLEKIGHWQQRKARTSILKRLSDQSLELVTVFKEANRDLIVIFLFHKAGHLQKYWFNLVGLQKIFIWSGDPLTLNFRGGPRFMVQAADRTGGFLLQQGHYCQLMICQPCQRRISKFQSTLPCSLFRGRILGRKPDKDLESFPPCYSKSPLQLSLEMSISSNSRNLLQFRQCVTVHCKGERRKT